MLKQMQRRRSEKGFTLIELLVVIVILGILAAVVVFAVGGITDKGSTSACKIDTRTLRTAEEAYFAKNTVYTDEAGLKAGGLLDNDSTYHAIEPTGTVVAASPGPPPTQLTATSYAIHVIDSKCGTPEATPGTPDNPSLVDSAHATNN